MTITSSISEFIKSITCRTLASVIMSIASLATTLPQFTQAQTSPVYTDLWWNQNESGWGLNLNHQNDIIFATWFTYGVNNAAQWYVMSDMRRQADGSYSGLVYQTTGVPFNQINGSTPTRSVNTVGNASLRFSSNALGTFSYTINGISQAKTISRQPITQTPTTCIHQSVATSRTSSQNYQDLWWVTSESGWGINLTHQADVLFATWFTYRADGSTQWLVASNVTRQLDGNYLGRLYRTTGLSFNLINNSAATQSVTDVGSISFRFLNGESGTMSYTLDGVTGSKDIVRQIFGSTVNICTNAASTVSASNGGPSGGGPGTGGPGTGGPGTGGPGTGGPGTGGPGTGGPGTGGPGASGTASCNSPYDLTAGNSYHYRTSRTAPNTTIDELHTVRGASTFGGKATIAVEVRSIVNGTPDNTKYSLIHYEDRGFVVGLIGIESFIAGTQTATSNTVFDPVDFQAKSPAVSQSWSGASTQSESSNASTGQRVVRQINSYSATIPNNENITVLAGTFLNTCSARYNDISTRHTSSVTLTNAAATVVEYEYSCQATAVSNFASIGLIKSILTNATCTGTPPASTPLPSNLVTTVELVRANVRGTMYP